MHDLAAVNVDRLAGDVAGVLGCQENGHRRDILGRLPTSHRANTLDFFVRPFVMGLAIFRRERILGRLPNRSVEVRLDHPR